MFKPILCIDFDGVIHSYTSPWKDATTIEDSIVPGFFEWARKAKDYFDLVIYSSRSKQPGGTESMELWLELQWTYLFGQGTVDTENALQDMLTWFKFAHEKPAAFLTIDDRAICFEGDWSKLDPQELIKFKPWNRRGV